MNKFTFGVLPKHVGTLTTLFTIDIHIIHCFKFGTHLLSTYEIRNNLKGPIEILKVLCALHIKENIQKPVSQHARFQWSQVAKVTGWLLLITIIE